MCVGGEVTKPRFTQYFRGSLSGLTIRPGKIESQKVISCLQACKEGLDINSLESLDKTIKVVTHIHKNTHFAHPSKNTVSLNHHSWIGNWLPHPTHQLRWSISLLCGRCRPYKIDRGLGKATLSYPATHQNPMLSIILAFFPLSLDLLCPWSSCCATAKRCLPAFWWEKMAQGGRYGRGGQLL